ncbi:MAG TPA: hypothetical protein PK299_12735 [Anaerolineales bacterium]|nr:hypothetical protein [Anaerolineales bacterium]
MNTFYLQMAGNAQPSVWQKLSQISLEELRKTAFGFWWMAWM